MSNEKPDFMNSNRIKEIQRETAYPNSRSVHQALLKVWNECAQQQSKRIAQLEADKAELVKGLKESNELMTMSHEMNLLFPESLDDNLKSQVLCNTDLIQKHAAK